ncbi:MAG: pyruvate kinase [Spirochaetes bacterium]|nr:pyruvate kinase [Spirochaetota bacterium]
MLIATVAPYVPHLARMCAHPSVGGLRFNTIMPIAEDEETVLRKLLDASAGKPLWVDLKTRQLRVTQFAYLPYAFVQLSRRIACELPATVLFKDGASEIVRIVDGDKLILSHRPARVVGAGEPVNVPDPSLRIEGFLTESDLRYVRAATKLGVHRFLLSFTESADDVRALLELDPGAEVVAKIESLRGLGFARSYGGEFGGKLRFMAARDDLLVNMGTDRFGIVDALADILAKDPSAIAASRILTSLEDDGEPAMGDIADLFLLARLGYRNFMLSDGLCFSESSFDRAVRAFSEFERRIGPGA